MKLIITGATGFIGRNFTETLHSKGFDILATGRSKKVGKEILDSGIYFEPLDILNKEQVNHVFSKCDCVIHCAGKAADWGNYSEFYRINVEGTRNIINACRKHFIKKIIFISTPSVYYSGEDRFNIKEEEPLPKKQFNYGKTKLIAERDLLELAKEGFKTIIFRPRAVYGKYDQTIVPRILAMSDKKEFPLINDGKALVDITYIDNLTNAVLYSLTVPDKSWNEIYNISNGDPISIREWFSIVLEVFERKFNPKNIPVPLAMKVARINEFMSKLPLGKKEPQLTKFSVGYMSKSLTMSIEKVRKHLNYCPEFSNKGGFQIYNEWVTN